MIDQLNLVVTLRPKEGRLLDVVSTAAALRKASLFEVGCLRYDVAVGGDLVYLFEVWVDQQALDAHEEEAHFRTGVAALQAMCKSTEPVFVKWLN